MDLVVLESPYSGDVTRNVAYARACLRHSLSLGEAPLAGHMVYTQPGVLDNTDPTERALGMRAFRAWTAPADRVVVYTNLGVSRGMDRGIDAGRQAGRPVVFRRLPGFSPAAFPATPGAKASRREGRKAALAQGARRPMKRVILESPFAGDIVRNVQYVRAALRHSLSLGEAPIASHVLYTQPGLLDDTDPRQRQWGIDAGLAWRRASEGSVAYIDLGISGGMEYGMKLAEAAGRSVSTRRLPGYDPRTFEPSPYELAYPEAVRRTFNFLHPGAPQGPVCELHGEVMDDRHLGPPIPLCRACEERAHQRRRGAENPADEAMRAHSHIHD